MQKSFFFMDVYYSFYILNKKIKKSDLEDENSLQFEISTTNFKIENT